MDGQQETPGSDLGLLEIAAKYNVGRSTVHGWVTKGVHVRGALVKLRAFRLGNQWRVTREALEEFIRKCSE